MGGFNSIISFMGNSVVIFEKNKAISEGGAVRCNYRCTILHNSSSNVSFSDNTAVGGGGAVNLRLNSTLSIRGSNIY